MSNNSRIGDALSRIRTARRQAGPYIPDTMVNQLRQGMDTPLPPTGGGFRQDHRGRSKIQVERQPGGMGLDGGSGLNMGRDSNMARMPRYTNTRLSGDFPLDSPPDWGGGPVTGPSSNVSARQTWQERLPGLRDDPSFVDPTEDYGEGWMDRWSADDDVTADGNWGSDPLDMSSIPESWRGEIQGWDEPYQEMFAEAYGSGDEQNWQRVRNAARRDTEDRLNRPAPQPTLATAKPPASEQPRRDRDDDDEDKPKREKKPDRTVSPYVPAQDWIKPGSTFF